MLRPLAIVALIFAVCSTASARGDDGPSTYTVCTSGCDFTSIQDAIDTAIPGSTILVKAGTYYENEINTKGLPCTITGEVASNGSLQTKISGANFDVDENSSVFYFNTGETSTTVIENLIIEDGNAHGYGGGIQIFNASPTIRSCVIRGNSALFRNDGEAENNPSGGGIYLSESDSLIEDCTITDNAVQWEGSNDAEGGGIKCNGGSPTLSGCQITANSIYYTPSDEIFGDQDPCGDCAGPQCAQAAGMGIAGYQTTLTITDCVIEGNTVAGQFTTSCDSNASQTASSGGGLWFKESTVSITDTVISNNWARLYGGIFAYESTILLCRSEIRGNNDTGIYLDESYEGVASMISECLIDSNTNAGISIYEANLDLTDSFIIGNSIGIDAGESASAFVLRTVINDNSYGGGQGGISLSSANGSTSLTLSDSHLCGNPVGSAGALKSNQVNTGYPSSQVSVDQGTVVSGSCQFTISVEQDGTGDFTNIQDAIDAAPVGATVKIGAGTWPGGWTTRERAVNIQGVPDIGNPPLTIIDGGGTETGISVVDNGGGQTTISNLQVINCFSQDYGAGMTVGTANLTLTGCIFQGNQTNPGYGAGILFTGSTATINSCEFIQNTAIAAPGGGMLISDGASVTISHCLFSQNSAANGGGAICVADDGEMTCINSTFRANTIEPRFQAGGAILITSAATAELTKNFFCGNSPEQIAGTYTDGGDNTLDDECSSGTVVTVASDGSAQFDSISAAIGAAQSFSTIQIAAGSYAENLDTQGKAIRLVGAVDFFGLPATFVSPAVDAGESTVLTCTSGEGPATILENLAFINGYNPGSGGGGITCSGSSPSFVNCLITDNFGYNAGGAYCENGSEARFYKCVFSRNTGGFYDAGPGGLASVSGSNVSLKDCLLCDNAGVDPQAPTNIGGQWTDLGGNELLTGCPLPPCLADINRDGIVNGVDLAYILERWGSDDPLADLNGDGQVDSADLGLMLGNWGSCV